MLVAVALAVGVVIWTGVAALLAAHDLQTVRADVHRLMAESAPDRPALEKSLQREERRVAHARALLRQPGPVVFGFVPVLGRNVTAERSVADASYAALNAGLALSRSTRDLGTGTSGVNLNSLRRTAAALAGVAAELKGPFRRLRAQPVGWTLPVVGSGVRRARDDLLGLQSQVQRADDALGALPGVLGGSGRRTIAVVLMNNAELRGAGGLPSAFATGTVDDGHLALSGFQDVNTVAAAPARAHRVDAPAGYTRDYGPYLANSTLWKNVTMSPQDPDSAAVLAEVAMASLRVRPDVVVLCDVPAAAAVISATGPVQINGESVSGDELTRRLLVDAYGDGSLSEAKQQRRRQVLDQAATEAFKRLANGTAATPAVLEALARAVAGRHLAVWSSRPDEERQLVGAGAAGAVSADGGDLVMPVLNNLGDSPRTGNKLDYYIQRTVSVDVRLHAHDAQVTQTVTLHNAAPDGLGPYVEGVAHPGTVRESLSMTAAAGATLESFTRDGASADVSVAPAAGAQQLTTTVDLARGATTTYRLQYRLPVRGGVYRLQLVPQALAQPAQLHLRVATSAADLGVVSGAPQPVNDRIQLDEAWTAARDLDIPVHGLRGLRGLLHGFAHFWTHRISL